MKLDLTKLPVAEAIIGFLIAALAVTFVLAFTAVNGGDEGQVVEPSPSSSPGGSPTPGGGPEVVMHDNSFAPNELTVKAGATVTIQELDNGSEPEIYTIVGPAEANPRQGRISNESPLGRALMDHRAGDTVRVDAPGGTFTVRIQKVE